MTVQNEGKQHTKKTIGRTCLTIREEKNGYIKMVNGSSTPIATMDDLLHFLSVIQSFTDSQSKNPSFLSNFHQVISFELVTGRNESLYI